MLGRRSPWFIFVLGPDAPWLCPRCRDHYHSLDLDEQLVYLINLSPCGWAHGRGAVIVPEMPPRGVVCRGCWTVA